VVRSCRRSPLASGGDEGEKDAKPKEANTEYKDKGEDEVTQHAVEVSGAVEVDSEITGAVEKLSVQDK